jgi:hypothetical protein
MVSVHFDAQVLQDIFGEAICLVGNGGRVNVGETYWDQLVITAYHGIQHYRSIFPNWDGYHPIVREYGYKVECIVSALDRVLASGVVNCEVKLTDEGDLRFSCGNDADSCEELEFAVVPISGTEYICDGPARLRAEELTGTG